MLQYDDRGKSIALYCFKSVFEHCTQYNHILVYSYLHSNRGSVRTLIYEENIETPSVFYIEFYA